MAFIGKTPTPVPLTASDIVDGIISESKLGANSVTTGKITDGTIAQADISDQAINEAKIQISNAPTNGYFLSAQSGNTGGMTWAVAGGGGKILQVQHTNSTPYISTTSQSFQTLVSVDITPSASNSTKILFGSVGEPDQIDGRIKAYMHRDSTSLSGSNAGGQIVSEMGRGLSDTGTEQHFGTVFNMMVDSPNTTSQVTYSIKVHSGTGGQIRVGNGGSSNMIALELGA